MTEENSPILVKKRSRLTYFTRHLSKSTSELNGHECSIDSVDSPTASPKRQKTTDCNPSTSGVIQRTHGFFSSLRNKWARARSREKLLSRKSSKDLLEQLDSNEYTGDFSSESSTPANSPRRRAITLAASSLAKDDRMSFEDVLEDLEDPIDEEHDNLNTDSEKRSSLTMFESKLKKDILSKDFNLFELRVHLLNGENLIAMDKNGSSDPYVKFKVGGKLVYKSKTISKNLNPTWDECFVLAIEDPFDPVIIKVYDHDWALQDDFMGFVELDLTQLSFGKPEELELKLEDDTKVDEDLGHINLTATLIARYLEDEEFRRASRLPEPQQFTKINLWSAVVTIVLVKVKNLPLLSDGTKITDIFVKFKMAQEKYKSKVTVTDRWLEQFSLYLYEEDQELYVTLWSSINLIGKCMLNLKRFTRETTHFIQHKLDDNTGELLMLLTISGTTSPRVRTNLRWYREDPEELLFLLEKYNLFHTFENMNDVGYLRIKVFRAIGLAAADFGGKSDPFCVIELVNSRLQTQTDYKTLNPTWNKMFVFHVKDITSNLEITVYDEDRNHKVDFLGKVAIPLLRVKSGVKKWYGLKDKKLKSRAKGHCPQVLVEITLVYNRIRAIKRLLQPKEEKIIGRDRRFKRAVFLHNIQRFKLVTKQLINVLKYVQSCYNWESPRRSVIAMVVWIFLCLYADIDTLPLALLLLIFRNWVKRLLTDSNSLDPAPAMMDDDDDEDDEREKVDKKTLKERVQAIQEALQTVQSIVGHLASFCESCKNAINFSVPELTCLAAIFLIVFFAIVYFIPLRYLILFWGLSKFSRRLLKPTTLPSNEVLNFLSRVPNDPERYSYREVPVSTMLDLQKTLTKQNKD